MKPSLTIIGLGHLSQALLTGWSTESPWSHITGIDTNPEKRAQALELGVHKTQPSSAENLIESDWLILAVRPSQLLPTLLQLNLGTQVRMVSLAAGIRLKDMQALKPKHKIYRCMSNRQTALQAGVSVLFGPYDSDCQGLLESVFRQLGETVWTDTEAFLDLATAVTGSFPAVILSMIDVIEKALVQHGFEPTSSRAMVRQLLYGTALSAQWHAGKLEDEIEKITVPSGTTKTLDEHPFSETLLKGLRAAVDRAAALSQAPMPS